MSLCPCESPMLRAVKDRGRWRGHNTPPVHGGWVKVCAVGLGMGGGKRSGSWWQEWWHTMGESTPLQSPLPMLWGGWGSKRHREDSLTPTAMTPISLGHQSRRGTPCCGAGAQNHAVGLWDQGWGHTESGWAEAWGPCCPIGAAEGSSSGASVYSHAHRLRQRKLLLLA